MSTFSQFTSISGTIFRVRPNFKARTFTIKTRSSTYRTIRLDKNEFDSFVYNNGNDWSQFLKSSDYYVVK